MIGILFLMLTIKLVCNDKSKDKNNPDEKSSEKQNHIINLTNLNPQLPNQQSIIYRFNYSGYDPHRDVMWERTQTWEIKD